MRKLREYGVYTLPGIERSLYLVTASGNTYFLYDCEFGARLPPRFQIAENGNLINWFNDFPVWTVDDLLETTDTYQE